jgi:hypothetical protein
MMMMKKKRIWKKKDSRRRRLNMTRLTQSKDTTLTTLRRQSSTESKVLSPTKLKKAKRLLPRSMLKRPQRTRPTKKRAKRNITRTGPSEHSEEARLAPEATSEEPEEETEVAEEATEGGTTDLPITMKREDNNTSREEVTTKEEAEDQEEVTEEEGKVASRLVTTRMTDTETTRTMRESPTTRSTTMRRPRRLSKQLTWLLTALRSWRADKRRSRTVPNHLLSREDREPLKGLSEEEVEREAGDTMVGAEEETISQGTPGGRKNRSDKDPFINTSKMIVGHSFSE